MSMHDRRDNRHGAEPDDGRHFADQRLTAEQMPRTDFGPIVQWNLARKAIEPHGFELVKAIASAVRRHSVRVEFSQLPDSIPGDIDGNSILIDFCREPDKGNRIGKVDFGVPIDRIIELVPRLEQWRESKGVDRKLSIVERPWAEKLFLVLHLFGHTYQWNQPDHNQREWAVRIGTMQPVPKPWYLEESRKYEQEANQHGLALLQQPEVAEALERCGLSFDLMQQWLSLEYARDWVFLKRFYQSHGAEILGGGRLNAAWEKEIESDGYPPLLAPKPYSAFKAAPLEGVHRQANADAD